MSHIDPNNKVLLRVMITIVVVVSGVVALLLLDDHRKDVFTCFSSVEYYPTEKQDSDHFDPFFSYSYSLGTLPPLKVKAVNSEDAVDLADEVWQLRLGIPENKFIHGVPFISTVNCTKPEYFDHLGEYDGSSQNGWQQLWSSYIEDLESGDMYPLQHNKEW